MKSDRLPANTALETYSSTSLGLVPSTPSGCGCTYRTRPSSVDLFSLDMKTVLPILCNRFELVWMLPARHTFMYRYTRLIRGFNLWLWMCFTTAAGSWLLSVVINYNVGLCSRSNDHIASEDIAMLVEHPQACGRYKAFIKWSSDDQSSGIFTNRCRHLTLGMYLLSLGNPRIPSDLSSKSSTLNKSSFCLSSKMLKILELR